jgi:hypothetical protein
MMLAEDLYFVWKYTEVDRAFWMEHLEGFLPARIIDAHTHIFPAHLRRWPMTEQMRRQYWVNEVAEPIDAATTHRCIETVFHGRDVRCLAFGSPSLDFDLPALDEYVRGECRRRGWWSLAILDPSWTAEQLEAELDKPGVIGVKPYYALLGRTPHTRDQYLESSIFEFLPHRHLEVLDARRSWVTLHVPRAGRLAHPDNIREVLEIRTRYPGVTLVVAHFGRCYTEPHARAALPQLAGQEGLYFDNSAVLNPAVHRLALGLLGPSRVLYGTDNPVFYMRGRQKWEGQTYINLTSHPFHFNRQRESPQVEATYTLYMYEALRAIRDACADLRLTDTDVKAIFHDNAQKLIQSILQAKTKSGDEGNHHVGK